MARWQAEVQAEFLDLPGVGDARYTLVRAGNGCPTDGTLGVLYVSDLLLQRDERNRTRYREAGEEVHGVFTLPEGVRLRHFERERVVELLADFELLRLDELEVVTMNGNPARGFQALARARP